MSAVPLPPALLALADQRLPSGGHVHSGGVEQAVADGLVGDVATLTTFLRRRLATSGRVAAGLAAAATTLSADGVTALDREADARMPSSAQRDASRAQGRGLLRTTRAAWAAPHPGLSWQDLGARPHHPIVLGCAARAAGAAGTDGTDGAGAALVAAYLTVSGPATAAQRLLGLDPVAVAAATVGLGDEIAWVAREAADAWAGAGAGAGAGASFDDLPDDGDPLLDLLAQRHTARAMTLFAS